MRKYKDNQLVQDENAIATLSVLSVIGDRPTQQDSFDYSLKGSEGLAVICDGMGGLEGGQIASGLATDRFIADYEQNYPFGDVTQLLIQSAKSGDEMISKLQNDRGDRLGAGTTCVAVVVKTDKLYWCSVGDSRAYLLRGEEFVQLTQDQNYGTVLQEQLRAGVIDEERFRLESARSEALISYLGIGDLSLIDYNSNPLTLESGDKIVLMSDGLYKLVPEAEIQRVIDNFKNSADALRALNTKADKASRARKQARDNMTVAILTMK